MPLYGILEAGNSWFATYYKHHLNKLLIETSLFDPCLMLTKADGDSFRIVGIQTNDTLILGDRSFLEQENRELKAAKLLAKPIERLTVDNPLMFNRYKLIIDKDALSMVQKGQGKRIKEVDVSNSGFKCSYIEQRARGAYIATICQPEAVYDLSVAA
jgi:hypothetical protein